jgi:CMP-N,N'-diacetyllegionaminic acid synthase
MQVAAQRPHDYYEVMMNFNVLAVIPARGGSKSIPKKNIVNLCGRPLIAYSIEAVLQCRTVTHHVVSTDSEEIAIIAQKHGGNTPFLRPDHLSGDVAPSIDVVLHAVDFMENAHAIQYDAAVLVQPTTPMRSSKLLDRAIQELASSDVDSVVSVVDVGAHHPHRMYSIDDHGIIQPIASGIGDPMMPRQKLPPVYIRSGDVYAVRRGCLFDEHSLMGRRSKAIVVQHHETVNIDEPEDLLIARWRICGRVQD